MDFSELYHGHDVTMHGVLDLQLADILFRPQRGETREDQFHRLSPFLHAPEVVGHPNCYSDVQRLCSLDQCLKEHCADTNVLTKKGSGEDWEFDNNFLTVRLQ